MLTVGEWDFAALEIEYKEAIKVLSCLRVWQIEDSAASLRQKQAQDVLEGQFRKLRAIGRIPVLPLEVQDAMNATFFFISQLSKPLAFSMSNMEDLSSFLRGLGADDARCIRRKPKAVRDFSAIAL